jgi:hypothetical protein
VEENPRRGRRWWIRTKEMPRRGQRWWIRDEGLASGLLWAGGSTSKDEMRARMGEAGLVPLVTRFVIEEKAHGCER